MATKTWTLYNAFSNGDRKNGYTFNLSGVTISGTTGATSSTYTATSVTLYLSAIKSYTTSGWLQILNSSGTVVAETDHFHSGEDTSVHSHTQTCTFNQSVLDLGTSLSVKVRSTGNGNACNLRGNCTFELTVECTQNNVKPNAPTINHPAAVSKVTYNSKPYFKMTATDPDSDKLKYYYKIDSGSWTAVGTTVTTPVNSGTAVSWQHGTALSAGSHTLYVKCNDGTVDSDSTSRSFTYTEISSLSTGDKITRAQMNSLATYINNLSAYYGTGSSTTITVPTQYDNIADTDWTNYATKINATAHISGLAKPADKASATRAYYNSYITKLKSG